MTALPASLPWIEKLIRIDSISQTSNLPAIELIAAEFERYGYSPHLTHH